MSNTHPLVIVIFVLLLGLALYSNYAAKPIAPTEPPKVPDDPRAHRRRTDPVWKDRGTLK